MGLPILFFYFHFLFFSFSILFFFIALFFWTSFVGAYSFLPSFSFFFLNPLYFSLFFNFKQDLKEIFLTRRILRTMQIISVRPKDRYRIWNAVGWKPDALPRAYQLNSPRDRRPRDQQQRRPKGWKDEDQTDWGHHNAARDVDLRVGCSARGVIASGMVSQANGLPCSE